MTRSDVLRGQSWEVANADDSRSTRGGQVGSSYARRREKADALCAAGACAHHVCVAVLVPRKPRASDA